MKISNLYCHHVAILTNPTLVNFAESAISDLTNLKLTLEILNENKQDSLYHSQKWNICTSLFNANLIWRPFRSVPSICLVYDIWKKGLGSINKWRLKIWWSSPSRFHGMLSKILFETFQNYDVIFQKVVNCLLATGIILLGFNPLVVSLKDPTLLNRLLGWSLNINVSMCFLFF